MKKVGLFFGSFNPIHTGHLAVAEACLNEHRLDQVWFVVSPQNPFKLSTELAPEEHRLEMAKIAIAGNLRFAVSDIEMYLPKPSYTRHTLAQLTSDFPDHRFSLILGEDILVSFHKWKEDRWKLDHFELLVYPRAIEPKTDVSTIDWSKEKKNNTASFVLSHFE